MGSVVEELIVRYKLDAKDFLDNAGKVDNASKRNRDGIDSMLNRQDALMGKLKGLGLGLFGAAAATTAFGFSAMQAAAKFDTMERVFGAAMGSVEGGKRVMQGLEDYATKSAFSLEALADAAKTLAAGGMDISRFLPIIERFALVISGVDPGGLQMVAGALLRAKGGGFGEAMEIFRRAGVGTPELKTQGLNVSKGGEVQATAEQFLAAIQNISEGRLKTMADAVSGGAENKIANVGDVIGQAFRRVGDNINSRFMPAITAFTGEFKNLVDSGTFESFTSGMLDLAGVFTKDDLAGAVQEFGVSLRQIPDIIGRLADPLKGMRENPVWKMAQSGIDMMMNAMTLGGYGAVQSAFQGSRDDAATEAKAMSAFRRARTRKAGPTGDPLSGGQTEAATTEMSAQSDLLRQIAENTKPIQDFKRMILGGGEVGAKGINAVEIGQLRRGAHGEAMRLMSRAFGLMLDPYLGDLARAR